MDFENESAFRELVNKENLNLFLGAGFSILAKNRNNEPLMLGPELREYLIQHFELKKFRDFSLSQIAAHLKRNRRSDLYDLLNTLYKVDNFDPRYYSIIDLPIENIFTINIDDLCESICNTDREGYDPSKYINDVEIYGYVESPGISLFKLHGSITHPYDKEILFSTSELSGLFLIQPSLFYTIANKIAAHPTLFWGVNLDSPNIIDLLKSATIDNRPSQPKWIVVLPDKEYDTLAEEYSSEGFRIIRSTTNEMLSYFKDSWERPLPPEEATKNYGDIFPHNYIPSIINKKYPVRPLAHFYQGAEPSWNDILNNNLVKTSQYSSTLHKILNSGTTLILGSPGCGKTTLLMQLATCDEISGTKFYFSDIQLSQAEFIKRVISDEPHVTIFFDNVSESIDAYQILNAQPNITLVTADRDLRYETVRHLLGISNNRIIDVSNLTSSDIQKICDSMNRPPISFRQGRVSLFEICYQIWAGNKLETKIKDLVLQLIEMDSSLIEFYTLLTYVRYCGISASMDMLIYYYSNYEKFVYKNIYEWVDTIYSLIDDSGYPEDNLQDFFTLRSAIFSELSMKYLPSDILFKVINNFHRKVHKGIIPRFDIFRRKAFDADIMKKAFPIISDGVDFYESILRVDNSPFTKQQYALYLWRKGKKELAWKQIDTV